ncbi:unnamed protein product [Urochloa decumbens]|uniref:Uncharacterized protein n=1 Tax=Urochloa decumbens TaxID=240449 RepID=A0ABC8WEI9_9POAL
MAASTAAALMKTAAARRLLRYASTSTMVLQEVSGSHKLTINGCQRSKNLNQAWAWDSQPFRVGGHSWRIKYYPQGHEQGHISLYLELDSGSAIDAARDVTFRFSVLDQSGNPVPKLTRATTEPRSFPHLSATSPTPPDLGAATSTSDDDGAAAALATSADAAALAPKLHGEHHLTELLWKQKRGADVTVDVVGSGEATTFDAHVWLLAERSPVFKAELELNAASNSKKPAAHRRIEIKDVEPRVFKAMLHYMYNNALPEMEEEDDDALVMAQGLLAAADRFKVDGLKLTCEETVTVLDISKRKKVAPVPEGVKEKPTPGRDRPLASISPPFPQILDPPHSHHTRHQVRIGAMAPPDITTVLAKLEEMQKDATRKHEETNRKIEETLSKRIDVSTAAGTLAVAEQHGCGALKAACLEFMSRPENLKAVMETEGYEKAKATIQPLVMELGMKQWLAFIGAAS